jgi:diadenosine tetraphosphate (Ap4A) HIT family hydrolase
VTARGDPSAHNAVVTAQPECLTCAQNSNPDLPPRERVHEGQRWRVAHAFGTALPGWLVVLPRRHVTSLDELTAEEAADLGTLLRSLTAAMRDVVGCAKTYVALFAEAEGFAHVHFHVIPRAADLQADLRGPRIFGLLGGDPERHVPDAEMDDIAARLTSALRGRDH